MLNIHLEMAQALLPQALTLDALRRWSVSMLVWLHLLMAGCAGLPTGSVQRLPSQALLNAASVLAQVVRDSTTASNSAVSSDESGVRLLAEGDAALDARLALIQRAELTLDVQYYQIASDAVGLRFFSELRQAAARGVRVRLLIDDLHTAGQDPLFAVLAQQPGIELRLFNPLPARGDSTVVRLVRSMHQFSRINRRMHNKLFLADGVVAVVGGRNIADAYFAQSAQANFIDLDVLVTGAVVAELAGVFDAYWNSESAWPVLSLVTPQAGTASSLDALLAAAAPALPVAVLDRLGHSTVAAQLASGRLGLTFARVQVAADDPAKALGQADLSRSTRAVVSAAMAQSQDELMIVSPYFIPGVDGMALLQGLCSQHTRLTVLTNSLGATDEPLVHAGYAKYRRAMLTMGVKLHELGAALLPTHSLLGGLHSSAGRLHAKVAVIDGQRLVVGSMNMDARSARHNTEISLLIDSPALAAEVTRLYQSEVLAGAYQLRLAANATGIEWRSQVVGREVLHAAEPDAGLARTLRLMLLGALVSEDLL